MYVCINKFKKAPKKKSALTKNSQCDWYDYIPISI